MTPLDKWIWENCKTIEPMELEMKRDNTTGFWMVVAGAVLVVYTLVKMGWI